MTKQKPRWKTFAGGAALLLLAAAIYAGRPPMETSVFIQPAAVTAPEGDVARSTALIISGEAGWTPELAARAQRLSQMHTLVIGVDGPQLLAQTGGDCAAAAPALAALAARIQHQKDAMPRTPVLTGLGDGATIAFHAADAAPDKFKGLVTADFDPGQSICPDTALQQARAAKAPVRWLDVASSEPESAASGVAGATVVVPEPDARRAFYQAYLRLAGTDHAFDTNNVVTNPSLQDLPLTIHQSPNAAASGTYAIFLSGDGGWAKFDEQVAERLAAQGIPVAGISSLRYMWREKTPTQIAADLARIDAHFRGTFEADRVLLLGFSLGANTLPFAAAKLPGPMRERLAGIGLIAPETHTGFEIVVGGWLGQRTGSVEVAPAISALASSLPATRVMCLYGSKEKVSACPAARLPGMHSVEFEGGHHLGNNYDNVVRNLAALASAES